MGAVQQAKEELVFAAVGRRDAAAASPGAFPHGRRAAPMQHNKPALRSPHMVALPALCGNAKLSAARPALLPMPMLRAPPKHCGRPRFHPVSEAIMAIS